MPGIGGLLQQARCGLDTPTLFKASEAFESQLSVIEAIDHYLAVGDLSCDRGNIVDGHVHRGQPIRTWLQSPRAGASRPVNIEPYAAAGELRNGNTIVLNDAQQRLGWGMADLCDDFGIAFRSHVQMNCYLSMGDAPGFGLHWDDHDVVILQMAGRKYWEVHAPTELGALAEFTPKDAVGDVVWSGVLQPGYALSIPRGWAHSVQGVEDEVSVHLTVSNRRPTGLDLFDRIDPELLTQGWRLSAEALEQSLATWCSELAAFPRNGPIEVLSAQSAEYARHEFYFALIGGAVFLPDRATDDVLAMKANGRVFEVPRSSVTALAFALSAGWTSIDEVASATRIAHAHVIELLEILGRNGLVHLRAA